MLSDSLWTGSTSPVVDRDESTRGSSIEKHAASSCPSSGSSHGSRLQAGCGAESSCSAGCTETDQVTRLRREVAELGIPIGFHGKPGIGKTTSAKLLGHPLEAFADPLRVLAAGLFGEDYPASKDSYLVFYGAVPREVMQATGDAIRAVSRTVMIQSLKKRSLVKGLLCRTHSIHDVRSRNEVDYIRNNGGVVVGLTDDPRGIHGGQRTIMRRCLDWLRGLFVPKLERRIPCDVWVLADRGEDYECRLLEAIAKAARKRDTGDSRLT